MLRFHYEKSHGNSFRKTSIFRDVISDFEHCSDGQWIYPPHYQFAENDRLNMFKHIDNLPLKNGVHVKLPEGIYNYRCISI